MTILQKAVTPQLSNAYRENGYDRVAGFVVPAGDVTWADTPAKLVDAHGLGFAGSPFVGARHLDVLRFRASAAHFIEIASAAHGFVDRPPFTGNGFVAVAQPEAIVPLSWMRHTRIPPGAELYRVHENGSQEMISVWRGVARGWGIVVGFRSGPEPARRLGVHVGGVAQWRGATFSADLAPDGSTVELATNNAASEGSGFVSASPGVWALTVPSTEVEQYFELQVEARWNGLPVRVVDEFSDATGVASARVSYLGHDADLAEQARMMKTDAGVYEETVPKDSLTDQQTKLTQLAGWPGA